MSDPDQRPLGLFIQPACLQHKYIRHPNSSHIFERPERLRAVLLGVAAAIARLEEAEQTLLLANHPSHPTPSNSAGDDLSNLLSGLSITHGWVPPPHLDIVPPPIPGTPGQVLLHHRALQLAHSPPPDGALHVAPPSASGYLRDLYKWANEAVERIKETGCEIPGGMGLNQGDLYLGPGSILAIEGAIQTVCQAIDRVCTALDDKLKREPTTPPIADVHTTPPGPAYFEEQASPKATFNKAFCAIRPPGHHCGEDLPSGFCYVNNVVVGALHAYLEHDIDRAIIIDFDLHHGNGTQALVMPLNAASYAEDLAVKAGKPNPPVTGPTGKRRRGWKGFYGSVHDIYSYPCEDGDIDLIKDASISLAAHGQYIENIHLQPYSSEDDFYERIYPMYSKLLGKAKRFMEETNAEPDRTIVLISAGFDACEHEHQGMQRHDRRVPVSFFSRYTRDIIAFANQYTSGKVVSVLEGGYSDRALTSAAMGHVIGMLDKPGQAAWWTEPELVNIEKATRKKRTGKIAPFPPELSASAHLVRIHALLAHFEGSTDTPSAAPSAANTPQPTSRMTLRDRKKATYADEDLAVTPPARKAVRGRGGQNGSTPRSKIPGADSANVTPSHRKVERIGSEIKPIRPAEETVFPESRDDSANHPATYDSGWHAQANRPNLPPIPPVPAIPSPTVVVPAQATLLDPPTVAPLTHVSPSVSQVTDGASSGSPSTRQQSDTREVSQQIAPPTVPASSLPATYSLDQAVAPSPISAPVIPAQTEPSHPRIILRIPRIPSGRTSPQPVSTDTQAAPPPSIPPLVPRAPESNVYTGPAASSLYPSLPNPGAAHGSASAMEERMAYREGSANTTSTEGEYQSAASEMTSEGEVERKGRDSSSEVTMPGKFGA